MKNESFPPAGPSKEVSFQELILGSILHLLWS